MSTVHVLAGIAWDPQIRGFLAVLVGVVVLLGSGLPAPGHQPRASASASSSPRAAFWGWLFHHGLGLVDLRHRRACSARRPHWEVTEVVYPGTEARRLRRGARALDTSELPPPEELDDARGGRPRRRPRATLRARTSDGWKLLPESNPAFGEAKAAVDEHFVGRARRGARDRRGRGLRRPCTPSSGAARTKLDDDPSRLDRHHAQAQDHVLAGPAPAALRHHPGAAA